MLRKAMAKVSPLRLAGDGQVGGLVEEVLREVHLAVLGAGQVVEVQGRHLEHLAPAPSQSEPVIRGVWT